MKCPNGHETPEDSAFCESCGTSMAAVAAPPAPDPEPTPDREPASIPPAAPPSPSTESSSGGGNTKWIIAAVVAVVVVVGVILVVASGGEDDSETTDTAPSSETEPPADTEAPADTDAPAEDESPGQVVVAFDAAVGDCVNGNVVVACDEPHDAIVFHVEELPVQGAYPGNQVQNRFADDRCVEVAEFEVTPPIDIADVEFMSSTRADWQNGIDRIVCFELL